MKRKKKSGSLLDIIKFYGSWLIFLIGTGVLLNMFIEAAMRR